MEKKNDEEIFKSALPEMQILFLIIIKVELLLFSNEKSKNINQLIHLVGGADFFFNYH